MRNKPGNFMKGKKDSVSGDLISFNLPHNELKMPETSFIDLHPWLSYWTYALCLVAAWLIYICSRYFGKHYSPLYQKLSNTKQIEYASRLLSVAHSFGTALGCLFLDPFISSYFRIGAAQNSWSNLDVAFKKDSNITLSPFHTSAYNYRIPILLSSLGYMICDGMLMTKFSRKPSKAMLLHHIGVSIAILMTLSSHGYGSNFIIALLFNEITTPLIHLRWFLLEFQMKNTWIYLSTEMIILLAFAFIRIAYNFVLGSDVLMRLPQFYTDWNLAMKWHFTEDQILQKPNVDHISADLLPYISPAIIAFLPSLMILHLIINMIWFSYMINILFLKFSKTSTKQVKTA